MFGRTAEQPGVTEAAVMQALGTVIEPELHRDLVSLNMIRNLKIDGGEVSFTIMLTTPACPLRGKMENDSRAAPYAVPYDGREVYLHWANKDQYYVKSSETLTNFSFDLAEALRQEQERQRKAGQAALDLDGVPARPLKVHFRISEGEKDRVQVFQGTVIRKSKGGVGATFAVRKISYGVGVERVFPVNSPRIEKVEIGFRGRVRRSRLFYLRERRGKAARIRERGIL